MSKDWNIQKAIGTKTKTYEVLVDNRENILYNLGIGF